MDWQSPKDLQLPQAHIAHVWRLQLDVDEEQNRHWYDLLSTEEKQCSHGRSSKRNRQYIATRGLLRELLSRYLDLPPDKLILDASPFGKPLLSNQQNPHNLQFNLSHSGDSALFVFACDAEVGIDLEFPKPKPFREIAQRFFHQQEFHYLSEQGEEQGLRDFFRYWTVKESILKAIGYGLQYGLDKVILQEPESSYPTFQIQLDDVPIRLWEIHRLFDSDDMIAAVALPGDNWKLEYYTL